MEVEKTLSGSTLTCNTCTGTAGEQLAGEPRWWTPAWQKEGMQGGAADKEVQKSGHTGWGRSRGPGSAGASPGKWPRRSPAAGPGTSSWETPGSTTSHPGSADRHWSKGWCGGPSLPVFPVLFYPFLSLSPHLTLSALIHIHSTSEHKYVLITWTEINNT